MTLHARYRNHVRRMVFLVVLAGLFLWGLWRVENHSAREQGDVLIDWPVENAELLVIERNDVRMECRANGAGDWRIVSPMDARADTAKIRRIIDTAAGVQVVDRIAASELRRRDLSLEDFGLMRPRGRLLLADAWRRFELLIGDDLALGEQVYASGPESADVLVLPRSLMQDWPASVTELRDRALLGGRPENVRRIEILVPGAPFVRLDREESGWRMNQPFNTPAADDRVASLLRGLYEARAKRFVWPRADVSSASSLRERLFGVGLDQDDAGIRVRLRTFGQRQSGEIRFGVPSEDNPGEVFAYWSADDSIVTVSAAILPLLSASPDSWRDPRLLDFNVKQVDALEIKRGNEFIRLERNAATGAWRLRAPTDDPADARTVHRFLVMLERLRNLEIVESDSAMPDPPEDTPLLIVLKAGTDVCRVEFHKSEKPGEWLARVEGEALVHRVRADEDALEYALNCHAAEFHDRTVLALPAEDIWRVRRDSGETPVVVERNSRGDWFLPRQEPGRLEKEALVDILLLASNLRAPRVVALSPSDQTLERYGLKEPKTVLTFDLRGGDALSKTLLVGVAGDPAEYFAMLRGHGMVVELEPGQANRLTRPLLKNIE